MIALSITVSKESKGGRTELAKNGVVKMKVVAAKKANCAISVTPPYTSVNQYGINHVITSISLAKLHPVRAINDLHV